jgi:hypothetical protein
MFATMIWLLGTYHVPTLTTRKVPTAQLLATIGPTTTKRLCQVYKEALTC